MKRATIIEVITSLLILLFMYAGVTKLIDYQTFKVQLSKSPFITQFADNTAWALPLTEILVALALMINKTRLIALYISLFLMTMFAAYIYAILNFSYEIPCSCGGILSTMGWQEHLWFNLGFVVITIAGILLYISSQERFANKPGRIRAIMT